MAQKHRRSNREQKKPKQDKSKVIVAPGSVAATFATPVKAMTSGKRK